MPTLEQKISASARPLEHVSTQELQMRWMLFQSMRLGLVDKVGAPAIRKTIHMDGFAGKQLQKLTRFIMEQTAVKVFFGGVGDEQNMETARGLLKRNIGTIIDNAAPESTNGFSEEQVYQNALAGYAKALEICDKLRNEFKDEPEKQGRIAAAFKLTTVAKFEDLKAISARLEAPENQHKPLGERDLGELKEKFDAIYSRAVTFFESAKRMGIEPYMDAEETSINHAIIETSARMMKQGLNPTITIQAYLKDAEAQLDQVLTLQPPPNVKLVRGAYIGTTNQPREAIWDKKEETDACYNRLLEKLYKHKGIKSITVASHNQQSRSIVERLVRESQGRHEDAPHIVFATLLGMGANLETPDPRLGIEERKYQPAILDESTLAVLSAIEYFARRGKEFMTTPDAASGKTRGQLEIEAINAELHERGMGERALAPFKLMAESIAALFKGKEKTAAI